MSFDLVVVGLGYAGLPLARRACSVGLSVAGLDNSPDVVSGLRAGRSHVQDVTDADLADMFASGFQVTADPSVVGRADTIVICVPTGLTPDGTPDLGHVIAATTAVGGQLSPGTLVVLESTTYPGTTEEIVLPILESGGLVAGQDFYLGYSPERVDPGNPVFGLANTPKIVSGVTPLCAKRSIAFYEQLVGSVVAAKGVREAETAKLLENTYRDVNIALANEVAMLCDRLGVDVWEVVRCAATKPFGFESFRPGPGVGGQCIPVDSVYLTHKAELSGVPCRVMNAARHVNKGMPGYVAGRACELLTSTGTPIAAADVLLLGVTYKPDAADVRESPAVDVVRGLRMRGATVRYHDPYAARFVVDDVEVPRVTDLTAGLGAADLTILLREHRCYDLGHLTSTARALFDTSGRVDADQAERL